MTRLLTFAATICFVCLSFLGKADLPYKNLLMGTPVYSNTINQSGAITSITFTIPIEITMRSFTESLPQIVSTKWESAFSFAFQNGNDPSKDTVFQNVTTALSSTDAVVYYDGYILESWTTKHFVIKITLNASPATSYYRIHLKGIHLFSSLPLAGQSGVWYPFDAATDFQLINTKSTTGINANSEKNFQFYPNPVVNKLNIETSLNITEVKIIDLNGKTVFEGNERVIDVMNLPKGIYIIQIKSEDTILTKKFVKN